MSTIFISHSSADNELAKELFNWVKSQGYKSVFLDLDSDDGIKGGERWKNVLYRELVSCSVVIALITENWQASKWCFAEVTYADSSGKTILGLMTSSGIQPAILADTQLIDYHPGNRTEAYQRLAEALRRAIDPQGLGKWDSSRPLFPGLLTFDEKDASIFFGRRRLGRAIYQKLQELQAKPPGSERLLLVFGPSGSGKSSVVRAGTLPHIHANRESWIMLGPFRPTEGWPEPLRQCMELLTSSDEKAIAVKLHEIADQLRGDVKAPKATILLVIDQLEEALDIQDGTEAAFWLPLSRLLAPNGTPFMAVATLRSDFMGDFQARSAQNAIRFTPFSMESMSPQDIREVITGPCQVAGIDIKPSLVDVLVEDIRDEQALPLLALALNRLWQRYESGQGSFTVTDYRDNLKGMQGLIDREAESILAGTRLQAASVLDAFLNLIRLVREGVTVRHSVEWDVLKPEAQKSLKPFIDAHLLVSYSFENQDKSPMNEVKRTIIVDLVHETLLSGWGRLHKWALTENREFLLWREELRHKVTRWSQAKEHNKPLVLLEGTELKEAKKWLHSKRLALTIQEAAYIEDGIKANKISWVKLAVTATVLATVGGGWWGFTRTDIYQIKAIESAFPETMRTAISSERFSPNLEKFIQSKFTQLMELDRFDLAIIAGKIIDNEKSKANSFRIIAKRLAETGQTQQAIQILSLALAAEDKIDDAEKKSDSLREIALALEEAGHAQHATQTLTLAETAMDKIDDSKTKADILGYIAGAWAGTGLPQQAFTVVDKIDDAEAKADILRYIAQARAKVGQVQVAFDAVDKIDNAVKKADALRDIALVLAKAGQAQQAFAAADKIDDADMKAYTLGYISQAWIKAGLPQQALVAVDKIDNAEKKADALRDIAPGLAKAGQAQQVLVAADKIDDADMKAKTLGNIAQAWVDASLPQQALAAVDKINDTAKKVSNLVYIAQTLEEAGQAPLAVQVCDQAQAIAEKIDNAEQQAIAFVDIAQALAETGQTQRAAQTLILAQTSLSKIDKAEMKADALRYIAPALARAGQAQQALAAADKIHEAEEKTDTLMDITEELAEAGLTQQAVAAADKIDEVEKKARSLVNIVKALVKAGQTQQAIQTLTLAQVAIDRIQSADDKIFYLGQIAEAQAKIGLVQQAFATADRIQSANDKKYYFGEIAMALAMADQIHQALLAIEKIDGTWMKTHTLKDIAKALVQTGQIQNALVVADKIDEVEKRRIS